MPGFRAPILLIKKGSPKSWHNNKEAIYIMPGFRAPILLIKKGSPKSWHNNKERILFIYYARN